MCISFGYGAVYLHGEPSSNPRLAGLETTLKFEEATGRRERKIYMENLGCYSAYANSLQAGNSMNNRANIMYFIEHLCDMAARENHYDYIRMMQRDILRMVDAVAPEDGSGAANVKVVRKVLQALQHKSFLLAQTVSEIEDLLHERDTLPDNIGLSSPLDPSSTPLQPNSSSRNKMGAPQRLDKKQIETRIEEDRERHKRLRENIWAIPKAVPGNSFNGGAAGPDEFDKLWEETSDLGEDDLVLYREEGEERSKACVEWTEEFAKMHATE